MADAIPLSEIPTLSLLYNLNRIAVSSDPAETQVYPPKADYNDKISVIRQDITVLAVDSIVNAANNSLLGGGGVDGAIHRAAGPELFDECKLLDGCETGSAKITNGYQLPAKKVIHAVGPVYWKTKAENKHTELLSGCYQKSLELAVENKLTSIAFSALSTGVYGYPSDEASACALDTVRKFLDEGKGDALERIIFCNFMQKDENAYFKNIPKYFPPAPAEPKKTGEPKATEEADHTKTETTDETELAAKLPDPPTTEPKDPEEPSAKKQKIEDNDFVVVDSEDAKEAKEAEVKDEAAPKADL